MGDRELQGSKRARGEASLGSGPSLQDSFLGSPGCILSPNMDRRE